jgi:phytoene synthase
MGGWGTVAAVTEYNLFTVMDYCADMRRCRSLLRGGSRSFYAASLLLPGYYRAPATALYAFCRVADDEVDLRGRPVRTLASLRERLYRVYQGRPINDSVDRMLANVVARFDIPVELPEALLEGFEWDFDGRHYLGESDIYAYSARVAGTVGAMMAMLMGVRDPVVMARACDLGVAMQLTNIARDVGEDARAGRLYLPYRWMQDAGLDPECWLAEPAHSPELAAVVQRLLQRAERLYERSAEGIASLPLACRPAMFAARSIYREIGRELERRGLDSVNQRTVVSHRRKVGLLAAAYRESLRPASRQTLPPLEETRFLVEAAAGV